MCPVKKWVISDKQRNIICKQMFSWAHFCNQPFISIKTPDWGYHPASVIQHSPWPHSKSSPQIRWVSLHWKHQLLNTFYAAMTRFEISQVSWHTDLRQFNLKSSADIKVTPSAAANQLRMFSVRNHKRMLSLSHTHITRLSSALFIYSLVCQWNDSVLLWLDQRCQEAACLIRSLFHCS